MAIDTKPLIASKTVWGGVLAALPSVAQFLAHYGVSIPIDMSNPATALLTSAIGVLTLIYGRVNAVKPISGLVTTPPKSY